MLEIISTFDPAAPYALVRRHRDASGLMTDTVLSRWPTKNSAFDALFDELHAIVRPRRTRRFERAVTIGGSVSACLTLVAVALAGLLWLGASIDPGAAYDGAPYAIVTVDR